MGLKIEGDHYPSNCKLWLFCISGFDCRLFYSGFGVFAIFSITNLRLLETDIVPLIVYNYVGRVRRKEEEEEGGGYWVGFEEVEEMGIVQALFILWEVEKNIQYLCDFIELIFTNFNTLCQNLFGNFS